MFTGLVEDLGTIVEVRPRGNGLEIAIRTKIPLAEVAIGDSIAVNGVCLTAERCEGDRFIAVAGRETLQKTALAGIRPGERVHLERAMQLGGRLGGHLVQGHVDGVGRVERVEDAGESWVIWLSAPPELARYIAPKGSITIDGVSLTVNEVHGNRFRVNIVPHTRTVTRLGLIGPGDPVNLEVDVIAKYVERLLGERSAHGPGLTLETLAENGYLR
jgi:riboflavin synthase